MKPSPLFRVHFRTIPPTTADGERKAYRDAWLEQPIGDQWAACFRLAIQDGQPVISEVRLIPSEDRFEQILNDHPGEWSIEQLGSDASVPPGGIGSELVRRIHFGDFNDLPEIILWAMSNYQSDDMLGDVDVPVGVAGKRPGPKGPSDYELAVLASRYVEETASGNTRPIKTLAKEFHLSPYTIRDRISRAARDRGLLTKPAKTGKAGGHLTPRAEALIEQAQKGVES